MKNFLFLLLILVFALSLTFGQSGKIPTYSESSKNPVVSEDESKTEEKNDDNSDEIIRINTDLVVVSAKISEKNGKIVSSLGKENFSIFENGVLQEIVHFSGEEEPVTVILVMDMSYSSAFKLSEIQKAALTFVNQLRADDKVMVVSFHEKTEILCPATTNRKINRLAIEGTLIKTGTGIYDAMDEVLNTAINKYDARSAIVLLTDGVDTTSTKASKKKNFADLMSANVQIYPFQYYTYSDVQKLSENETIEGELPTIQKKVVVGTRYSDYESGADFLAELASKTAGRVYKVSNTTNLTSAFTNLANELRKVYTIGYYPKNKRQSGKEYKLNVRVNRPNLLIRARESYYFDK